MKHSALALPVALILFCFPSMLQCLPLQQQNAAQSSSHNRDAQNPKNPASDAGADTKGSPAKNAPPDKKDCTAPQSNRDVAFWAFIVNLILTIATLVIAIFAVFQARATKIAADAAKTSADILQESQRPHIAAKAHGNAVEELLSDVPHIRIAIFNRGQTPAYDCINETWIELLPKPFQDFTPVAEYFKSPEPFNLYPDHDPVVLNIPFTRGLTEHDRADLKTATRLVCIRIRMSYKDAFSPDRHAEFGFYVTYLGLGFLPKHNQH